MLLCHTIGDPKKLRQHSAFNIFGTRTIKNCIGPLTILTMQRIVGDVVIIPTDDVALDIFLRAHFLPLPTYYEVHEHFKTRILIKSIRSNIWDATTPAAL